MKTPRKLATAMIATALATGIGAAALLSTPALASDSRVGEVRQLREQGKILPMEDILVRSRDAQPGQVLEVELDREGERYVYEVKILDDADRVHKLELDAASGEVLQRKQR